MKFKFYIVFFLTSFSFFGQTDVYYFKDISSKATIETVKDKEFRLLTEQILDPYTQYTYWFKIPAHQTTSEYIFRILYERITEAEVYQNTSKINKLHNQRFLSYQFSRKNDVYIKVSPKLHAYIPVELNEEKNSIAKEKNHLLFNSFYYGFAFLVIMGNLFYFFIFKDSAFLYYSLFLASMSFGVFIMDGMLNYFNIPQGLNDLMMILNYVFLAFFSSKFANNYLFLDNYYPKLKAFSYSIGAIIIVLGVLYLSFKTFYYLLFLNILVFALLLIYWISALLLFKNNIYTKILVFAYVIILFSGIDFFIFKFFGISIIEINATNIKIGAYLEMIILSVAVLYRMKTLKDENELMTKEIVEYAKKVSALSANDTKKTTDVLHKLSVREREIFDIIVSGKSNKEIASLLNISINTVKFHVKNIYEKLNIKSRKEVLILTKDL